MLCTALDSFVICVSPREITLPRSGLPTSLALRPTWASPPFPCFHPKAGGTRPLLTACRGCRPFFRGHSHRRHVLAHLPSAVHLLLNLLRSNRRSRPRTRRNRLREADCHDLRRRPWPPQPRYSQWHARHQSKPAAGPGFPFLLCWRLRRNLPELCPGPYPRPILPSPAVSSTR